ncbi:MAG: hypothetical protein COA97_10725 [Flavobacteriales bacterium]|nr:MAG: hypothetical protein COA97_10725 [Flavobacteriales bacterium]
MFKIFGKKKIQENIVANIFVNSILDTIDQGFPEIVGVINDAPEFTTSPNIAETDIDCFTLIVFAANISYIPQHLNNSKDDRITNLIISKLSRVFDVDQEKLENVIKDYQNFLIKVNHPSKNMLYAMSKGIFRKYNLNGFQDEYFKNMNSPNPMFLKRLDEAMDNFLWNWDSFNQKYQIS